MKKRQRIIMYVLLLLLSLAARSAYYHIIEVDPYFPYRWHCACANGYLGVPLAYAALGGLFSAVFGQSFRLGKRKKLLVGFTLAWILFYSFSVFNFFHWLFPHSLLWIRNMLMGIIHKSLAVFLLVGIALDVLIQKVDA